LKWHRPFSASKSSTVPISPFSSGFDCISISSSSSSSSSKISRRPAFALNVQRAVRTSLHGQTLRATNAAVARMCEQGGAPESPRPRIWVSAVVSSPVSVQAPIHQAQPHTDLYCRPIVEQSLASRYAPGRLSTLSLVLLYRTAAYQTVRVPVHLLPAQSHIARTRCQVNTIRRKAV